MSILLANRLERIETSAIRELFKVLGQPGIISFAGGFPDSALFDVEGIEKASQAVFKDQASLALQYGATEGYPLLREALVTWMNQKSTALSLEMQDIIVTTGSQQALDLLGKVLINEGDQGLVEGPTFLAAIQCFKLYGAQLSSVPVDEKGVQVDELEKSIIEKKPRFIYLIPTFGNPSGLTLSLERRLRILELARQYQVWVIEDDPYGDLYFDQAPPDSLLALSDQVPGSRQWLIHCGSLSKILSPGLRVGWMIAPEAILSKAVMCKQFSDAHTSTLAQAIAATYLQSGRMSMGLEKVRAVYAKRAHTMASALKEHLGDELSFSMPQGGLFIWAYLQKLNGNEWAKKAIEHQVAFVPGQPFFAEKADVKTMRLSFATVGEEQIVEGVKRLALAKKALLSNT